MSRYGIFTGPYFPVFSPNTEKYKNKDQKKIPIWTVFMQYFMVKYNAVELLFSPFSAQLFQNNVDFKVKKIKKKQQQQIIEQLKR